MVKADIFILGRHGPRLLDEIRQVRREPRSTDVGRAEMLARVAEFFDTTGVTNIEIANDLMGRVILFVFSGLRCTRW